MIATDTIPLELSNALFMYVGYKQHSRYRYVNITPFPTCAIFCLNGWSILSRSTWQVLRDVELSRTSMLCAERCGQSLLLPEENYYYYCSSAVAVSKPQAE